MKELIPAPPKALIDLVGGGFETVGPEFLRLYTTVGGLYPEAHVLDMGCGCGRMAIPLSDYMTKGTYRGFDVYAPAIDWCRENITNRYPNFRFDHVDAYNSYYNPNGTIRADEYRFPYSDASFDFAFASSLFTHIMWRETENYIREAYRVLRHGGRALFTFCLLNPETEDLIANGKSRLKFRFKGDRCRVESADDPARVVAYEEQDIRSLFAGADFAINDIYLGTWTGRGRGLTHQDMIVATKPLPAIER